METGGQVKEKKNKTFFFSTSFLSIDAIRHEYKRNDRLFLFFSGPGGTVANRWRTAADTGIYLVLYFFIREEERKE